MSSKSSNLAVIARYVEAFNRGDVETLRTLFTEDALIHGALGWGGLDTVVPIWKMLHEALAMELTTEGLVSEDDVVVARFTERGKSVGPFRGHAPTGQASEVMAMEWFEFRDGRIYRRWGVRDSASHFRQMGLPTG